MMVLVWQVVLIAATLVFLIAASYSDLKRREVPDWLSYGLVFSALGLRFIFSFENGWGIFLNGLFGFLVCLGIAYLFYLTNQWGGGDSKLLMGMGAVIGLGLDFGNLSPDKFLSTFNFSLLWFFAGLLFFGALAGLLWALFIAVRERGKFAVEFKRLLGSIKKWHFLVLSVSFGFLVLSYFYWFFWLLVVFSVGGFYLLCFVKAVEKSCFVKELSTEELTEGDWLAEDVVVGGKNVVKKGRGLEKKEIRKLRRLQGEGKLKKMWVKVGVPFVPSFLAAYLAVIFGGTVWGWLQGFLG